MRDYTHPDAQSVEENSNSPLLMPEEKKPKTDDKEQPPLPKADVGRTSSVISSRDNSDDDTWSYDSDEEDAAQATKAGAQEAKAAEMVSGATGEILAVGAPSEGKLEATGKSKEAAAPAAPAAAAAAAAAAAEATAKPPPAIRELTEASELRQLLEGSKVSQELLLACFSAKWCRPCVVFAPKLEKMAQRFNKMTFVKLNVDKLPDLSVEYNVRAVPTFVLFKNGAQVGFVASASQSRLEQLLLNNGAVPDTADDPNDPKEAAASSSKTAKKGGICGKSEDDDPKEAAASSSATAKSNGICRKSRK